MKYFTKFVFITTLVAYMLCAITACGSSQANDELAEQQDELTEQQKEDITVIVHDILPGCCFAMQNGDTSFIKSFESSNHFDEQLRKDWIDYVERRSTDLYGEHGSGYIEAVVFTTKPVISDIEFYDYKKEDGVYSVMIRGILTCTSQQKTFGSIRKTGNPYQETRECKSLITWDEDECYLISSLHF